MSKVILNKVVAMLDRRDELNRIIDEATQERDTLLKELEAITPAFEAEGEEELRETRAKVVEVLRNMNF